MTRKPNTTEEAKRLAASQDRSAHWKRWGPYLSERAWGTVREDYSADGSAWDYFPHDHARSRTYRWNEDGMAGICDRHQKICLALTLWNEQDSFLKERAFGLAGSQGNHGEDVKDYYFYLDNTPTHSYMKYLYKYPHQAFPYDELVTENQNRDKLSPEYELLDTGIFAEDRYCDVFVEYAKSGVEDLLMQVRIVNRGPDPTTLHVLPTVWFRNTWAWGTDVSRPAMKAVQAKTDAQGAIIALTEPDYGQRWLYADGGPETLFTENETNAKRLYGSKNRTRYVKDGINDYVVAGDQGAVNPAQEGTKAAAHYVVNLAPGEETTLRLRFSDVAPADWREGPFGDAFDAIVSQRRQEADAFYATVIPPTLSKDETTVMRQALAGLLWSKQFYHYEVRRWLDGDPGQPPPPAERLNGRNAEWGHLYNADVIAMPDKWEYPWYAAWDLAFHCVALALVDIEFAKEQLLLLLREWYMHPNGQIPAYEWKFGDVNPPVHAWAAWCVFQLEKRQRGGKGDRHFLERIFHKLMLNFTWWVNREDTGGDNIFEGGFLGLDNIGVFDRSHALPTGGRIEQSDGTSWMAMYTLNLLGIAIELAQENPVYEDVASKFFEHFIHIGHAMNNIGPDGVTLWDETEAFYYDVLHLGDGHVRPLRVRSMVGLTPLFAVATASAASDAHMPRFKRRLDWFLANRPGLLQNLAVLDPSKETGRRLFSVITPERLQHVLRALLDEAEFLSPHGIRALSRRHAEAPFVMRVHNEEYRVDYEPGESSTGLFGGNSNWRGPVWFPMNFLIIESLQRFHHFFGDSFTVECPTGSGQFMTLHDVAQELSQRLISIFLPDRKGRRPVFGNNDTFQSDPHWRENLLFFEYFHGDTGAGLGANHQSGWTSLVACLLFDRHDTADDAGDFDSEPIAAGGASA